MIHTGRRLLMPAAAVLIASACGGSTPSPFAANPNGIRTAPTVAVSNYNWQDVVVHATRFGNRVRIGEVTSQSKRTLTIPVGFMGADGTVGLQVSLIGSTAHFQTDEIHVNPDEIIVLSIQNNLGTSSWGIQLR